MQALSEDDILIVVDRPRLGESIRGILSNAGFSKIEVVHSGREALGKMGIGEDPQQSNVEAREFDLVILQTALNDMDGLELCAQLRLNRQTQLCPILALTRSVEVDVLNQTYMAGADDFVAEPIDELRVLARVRTLLRLNRERKRREAQEQVLRLQNAILQRGKLDDILIDPVTMLGRGAVVEMVLRNCQQNDDSAALSMLKIVDYDMYCQAHGKEAGDKLRRRIAGLFDEVDGPLVTLACVYSENSFMLVEPGAKSAERLARTSEALVALVNATALPHGNSFKGDVVGLRYETAWATGEDVQLLSTKVIAAIGPEQA